MYKNLYYLLLLYELKLRSAFIKHMNIAKQPYSARLVWYSVSNVRHWQWYRLHWTAPTIKPIRFQARGLYRVDIYAVISLEQFTLQHHGTFQIHTFRSRKQITGFIWALPLRLEGEEEMDITFNWKGAKWYSLEACWLKMLRLFLSSRLRTR